MGRTLSVKEFDTIVCNENYKTEYPYLPKPIFDELLRFIRDYQSADETSDVLDFLNISYKRGIGDVVNVKNHVGLIQLKSGFQIEILPKIDLSGIDADNSSTKRIFIRMLRTLKDFPSKVFSDAGLRIDKMNLYEIFISMFIKETQRLLRYGLKSSYVKVQDNLRFYKGKLLVDENIKANSAHKEKFFVSYDEFSPDCAENKLVKSTLLKLQKLTRSEKNSKEIKQLLVAFENVNESNNLQKDFASVNIDRTKKEYETLMKWARVFLLNKSFTTFSGSTNGRALLFPMEKVFESFVARGIKKEFIPDGWYVSAQSRGKYLFDDPKRFSLIPDIVLEKAHRTIIVDTKWKNLIDNKTKNYGISQADMYQMYAYSKKYNAEEIWLLYPVNAEMKNHEQITFRSNDKTVVNLFFIDLENNNIGELHRKITE